MKSRAGMLLMIAIAMFAAGCHSRAHPAAGPRATTTTGPGAPQTTTATSVPLGPAIVFNAQGSRLDAYATTRPFVSQTVVPSPAADKEGVDVSGQVCFDPTDSRRFVAVDRTDAADGQAGFGVFELSGRALAKLSAKEIGRLVPTYQGGSAAGPAPFGCAFLADGRLLTTDVGNPTDGRENGQLIEWFPPFDRDVVPACKLAVTLAAPMGVLVDGSRAYVAENRGRGVASFDTATFPTSEQPAGCSAHDSTGQPLAVGVIRTAWLQNPLAAGLERPAAVVSAGNGNFYVSLPRSGVIAEVTPAGEVLRRVLVPPPGEKLGMHPFSTGTPVGLGVAPDGTLYYADPGLVARAGQDEPGLRAGTIRRITFANGVAQRPEVVDSGLQAPMGIGMWLPPA